MDTLPTLIFDFLLVPSLIVVGLAVLTEVFKEFAS